MSENFKPIEALVVDEPKKNKREKSNDFAHVEDYENDPIIRERRLLLLQVISKLTEIKSETDSSLLRNGSAREDMLTEVNTLIAPLKSLGITKDYLKQFYDIDYGAFSESARRDPKIMTEWIAHDLVSIVAKASIPKDTRDFMGLFGALGFYKKALDAEE